MVNILYAVTAFVCSLVSLILPIRIRPNLNKDNQLDKSFLILIRWTAIFCLVDCVWGIMASDKIMSDTLLFICSIFFHLSAAFTPIVWLDFVLSYLGNVRFANTYRFAACLSFAVQVILIISNIFTKKMFFVNAAGEYSSTPVRRILFYMQYIAYILIGIASTAKYLSGGDASLEDESEKMTKKSYIYVLIFVASPILAGVFQMIYPDAPAYSIGYMLGCCVIYSFVLTDMLNVRMIEKVTLQASSRAKTEFLFNMSHDIRTPLNAITGFTAMAKKSIGDDEKTRDYLDKIDISGRQLLTIINQILEMSRIESGKSEISNKSLSVKERYDSMVTVLSEQARENGLDFKYSLNDLVHDNVLADDAKISSIVLNIAGNSVKYTPRGGSMEFSISEIPSRKKGYATFLFKFSDTGIGMSEDYLKVIFDPFTREHNSTVSKIQGTGLGMSIVKNLVDQLEGDIDIVSALGKGTTFLITLDLEIDKEIREAKVKKTAGEALFKGKKILLVEDNELNREIAEDILSEKELIIETAGDGEEAVGILKSKGPDYYDFILMDIQMPVMNGYEATAAIRRLYPDAKLPIIALSANAFSEDRDASLNAGMDGHVAKPINTEELFVTLAEFI